MIFFAMLFSGAQNCLSKDLAGQLSPLLPPGIGKAKLSRQISKTKNEFHRLKTRLVVRLCWLFGGTKVAHIF